MTAMTELSFELKGDISALKAQYDAMSAAQQERVKAALAADKDVFVTDIIDSPKDVIVVGVRFADEYLV